MPVPDSTAREPIVRPLNLDAGLAGSVGEPHYAIVDIGSNSVRMVVYDQLGRAPLPRYVEKSLCRLGDSLAQTGAISAEGFRRTVEALRRFRAIADAMGVARIDVTATEAIRRASNGPELAAAIKETSGLAVRGGAGFHIPPAVASTILLAQTVGATSIPAFLRPSWR